jgi:hypothetical protein
MRHVHALVPTAPPPQVLIEGVVAACVQAQRRERSAGGTVYA